MSCDFVHGFEHVAWQTNLIDADRSNNARNQKRRNKDARGVIDREFYLELIYVST